MLEVGHALLLAGLQGITEFLPISSSAHLILMPKLMGWADQGLSFDISVHMGTLLALLVYFRVKLIQMSLGFFAAVRYQRINYDLTLGLKLLFACLPVGLAGFYFRTSIEHYARDPGLIGITTLSFGILLGLSDWLSQHQVTLSQLTFVKALTIGLAQVLALLPGTSRSGITLTAGLACGLNRRAAAEFSFLLSIPVLVAAGGLELAHMQGNPTVLSSKLLVLSFMTAFVVGLGCIQVFLKVIDRVGLIPFALYRIGLGLWLCLHYPFLA